MKLMRPEMDSSSAVRGLDVEMWSQAIVTDQKGLAVLELSPEVHHSATRLHSVRRLQDKTLHRFKHGQAVYREVGC